MHKIENKNLVAMVDVVFTFENQKGHLKWKVSELARACKVSKSLVYYHLGKSKVEILTTCFDVVSNEFYGLTSEREKMVQGGNLFDSLKYTRSIYTRNPAFTVFYIKWRLTKTDLGKKMAGIDKRYQKKLALLFPQLSVTERVALQALFHGLVTAPVLDDEALKAALKWLPV